MVLWRPIRPSRTNTPKRCPFHYRGLKCKSRKSRDTWSNRQIWPRSTKWSRSKVSRVLPRETLVIENTPLPTTQKKTLHMDITSQFWNQTDYILCSQRRRSSIQSEKTRLGADCGSDPELLIAKIYFKLDFCHFWPKSPNTVSTILGCSHWSLTVLFPFLSESYGLIKSWWSLSGFLKVYRQWVRKSGLESRSTHT